MDAQVITEASGLGDVWTNGGNTAPVVCYEIPAKNDSLTWNGSVSGEKRGAVTKVYATVNDIEDEQYEGTPDVNAAGIITATQGTVAFSAALISSILAGKSLKLVTSTS